MLRCLLKKVSVLLVASTTMVSSASCYSMKSSKSGEANTSIAERVRIFNVQGQALNQEIIQISLRASQASLLYDNGYESFQEYIDALNNYDQVDFSQLSEDELRNVPITALIGEIVAEGSSHITNLKIDNFSSDLQDLIRSADDLHNRFENHNLERRFLLEQVQNNYFAP